MEILNEDYLYLKSTANKTQNNVVTKLDTHTHTHHTKKNSPYEKVVLYFYPISHLPLSICLYINSIKFLL
jgi:hypothetical protein